jgi:hypothetical protein
VRIAPIPTPRGAPERVRAPLRNRGFALLWLAAVLVPLLSVVGAGLASWRAVQAEAESRIERTVELLRQHALRAFGAQDAILIAIARAAAGRDADALRRDHALHALLADLSAAGAPVISGVLVTDAEMRIVSASWEFPARPADLSDRDYVATLRDGAVQRAVGEPVASRPMGWPIIPVARRAPDGAGILVSSFSPAEITDFYASVAETPSDVVALMRQDGTVLARHPVTDTPDPQARRGAIAAMLGMLAAADGARWVDSPLDGARRLFVARTVGGWPVMVAYGLDRRALVAAWWQRMVAPGTGGAAAMALLLALTATAQASARRQREQAESRAEAEAQLARAGRAAAIGLLAAGWRTTSRTWSRRCAAARASCSAAPRSRARCAAAPSSWSTPRIAAASWWMRCSPSAAAAARSMRRRRRSRSEGRSATWSSC